MGQGRGETTKWKAWFIIRKKKKLGISLVALVKACQYTRPTQLYSQTQTRRIMVMVICLRYMGKMAPRVGFAANNAVRAEREAMGLRSRWLSLTMRNTALDAYSKTKTLPGRHSNWKHKMESYTLYSTLDSFLQKRSFKHWGK